MGKREMSCCNAASMDSSADPGGNSEDELALLSCPELDQEGLAIILRHQAVARCRLLNEGACYLARQLLSAEVLLKGNERRVSDSCTASSWGNSL